MLAETVSQDVVNSKWTKISGGADKIAVAGYNSIYTVNKEGHIWHYVGSRLNAG